MSIQITPKASPEILLYLNRFVHAWHIEHYPGEFQAGKDGTLLEYFRTSLANDSIMHYVAYDGSDAVGFIQAAFSTRKGSAFRPPKDLINIRIISVLPEYQRKGIGGMLIDKIFQHAREKGIGRIELDCWDGNGAKEMFEKHGFRPIRHYLGIDLGIGEL